MARTLLLVAVILVAMPGAVVAIHLAVLALASTRYTEPEGRGGADLRLLVLIPAHDEEAVIGACLDAIARDRAAQDIILVVADRCSDATARVARSYGATVLERPPDSSPGRAAARQAGVDHALTLRWDAMVMIDADSVIEPGFFDACRSRLAEGVQALQARSEAAPGRGLLDNAQLAAFALQGVTYPRGRDRLGLVVRLRGTGMILARELVQAHSFRAAGASEDLWFTLDMCLAGVVPRHVDGARLRSANTHQWAAATTQRRRYESGRMEAAREFVLPLLSCRNLPSWEAALHLMTLPLAPAALLLILGTAGAVALDASALALVGIGLLATMPVVVGVGLVQAQAPASVWLALLAAPWYVLWKSWVQLLAMLSVSRGDGHQAATPRTVARRDAH